jgi:hypothetical protein
MSFAVNVHGFLIIASINSNALFFLNFNAFPVNDWTNHRQAKRATPISGLEADIHAIIESIATIHVVLNNSLSESFIYFVRII